MKSFLFLRTTLVPFFVVKHSNKLSPFQVAVPALLRRLWPYLVLNCTIISLCNFVTLQFGNYNRRIFVRYAWGTWYLLWGDSSLRRYRLSEKRGNSCWCIFGLFLIFRLPIISQKFFLLLWRCFRAVFDVMMFITLSIEALWQILFSYCLRLLIFG